MPKRRDCVYGGEGETIQTKPRMDLSRREKEGVRKISYEVESLFNDDQFTHWIVVCVGRCLLATTADSLVIRVCPVVGLGRDAASLEHQGKGRCDADEGEKRKDKGEAKRTGRGGQGKAA